MEFILDLKNKACATLV